MRRYAIVDTTTNRLITVVEYDTPPADPPPGFGAGVIAIQNDSVGGNWTYNGTSLVPPAPPDEAAPITVTPQDLMAQLTAADIASIQSGVTSNSSYALLWYSMLAQRDPMDVTSTRFLSGWSSLVAILGQPRMNEIAAALNVPSLVVG